MKNRILAGLLSLGLLIGMMPMTVFAVNEKVDANAQKSFRTIQTDEDSWEECISCTEDEPHMIATSADLDKIRTHICTEGDVTTITGYFKLANDIIFANEDFEEGGDYYNDGQTWIPIGHNNLPANSELGPTFCGLFDGDGYSIQNLKMCPIDDDKRYRTNYGVFMMLGDGGVITNTIFEGIQNTVRHGASIVVGAVASDTAELSNITIQNCEVKPLLYSAMAPPTLLSQKLMGKVNNITILDSLCATSVQAWYSAIIAGTIRNAQITDMTIKNCKYGCGAYSGLLARNMSGNNSMENISITDTEYIFTHADCGALIANAAKDSSLFMKNVDIDITYNNSQPYTNIKVTSIPENLDLTFDDFNLQYRLVGQNPTIARWWDAMDEMARGKGMANLKCIDAEQNEAEVISYGDAYYVVKNSSEDKIKSTEFLVGVLNGGEFPEDVIGIEGELIIPVKEGSIFEDWYDNAELTGDPVNTYEIGKTYYAKWIKPEPVEIQYSETKPIVVPGMTDMTGWSSSDESVVTVDESGNATAVNVGTAKISAEGVYKGRKQNFTITVNVSPMLITYGSTGDDAIGWDHTYNRPAVVYSQPVGENEEQLSDHIWFYPAKESVDADSGEKIYIPDTEAAHIELEQGKDFTFSYTQNDNHVESTGVLPFLETVDSEGISEAIDVIVDMQNENYQFVTIGTLWKPWDQILLRVTVMAEGMERISMMNGDELLQNSLEKRILEYTGEGVAPAYDLTGISAEDIGEFTVHFHSVIEGISYDTHLYNKQPAELSADAVQAIAPKELGIYSMVVNGQNDEAKKYAYVSRRFEITKGNPTGEPEFDAVDSNVELSAIELSGSMKNAAGKPVEGVFEWIDDSQTVEQGVGYAWRFTPDDTEHYNAAEGESVVYPEEKPGSDKEDLAALIEYAQDAKDAENYKYVVPKVKELFEKALEDAIAVNAKEDATQKEIDAAYDALLAKVHLLDFTGNTESLTVLVGTASGKVEAMYTKESWAPFAEALEAAREVLADENALQAEIDTARDVLQAAMDALVENPIDTSKLEKLVADASVYEENLENYIPSTAESFMAALDGAREVLAGSEITQDAVDSAYATLLNAIFGLREVPNKDRLEELLGKVEAMDLSSYSEETANAVKAAVAMAAAVMEDENANQKQVDLAVTALEEAVAGLEAKEEPGADDTNTDNTESGDIDDGSKKDDSSVTDQKVASNDEGSKDTANKTTTAKTNAKTAAQTGDAAKAAVPAVAAAAALLAVWFVWKKK